jgi:predicted Zn-dependent peptidase
LKSEGTTSVSLKLYLTATGFSTSSETSRRVSFDFTFATAGWKTYLVGQIKNGESLEDLENYEKILWSITPEDIQKAFNKLINLDNQVILSIGEFTPCEN